MRVKTVDKMKNELKVSSKRTGGKITKILYKLNLQAKEEIKGWFDYRTPFEFQKSLMFLEYIIWKTIEISESIKDERVQLEPMGRIADIDAQKRRMQLGFLITNQKGSK